VDPVPDTLLLRKSGSSGNRTRDLCICSQKLGPLDHRGGHIRHILEKKWEYNEAVHQLVIDFKKAYDSVGREVLYNLIEFGIPMKLIRLMKMCLKETYSRVRVVKQMSDIFPIRNG
jgi:hypothetical protein